MPDAPTETAAKTMRVESAGLTSQEAEQRLRQFGPNDPSPARRRSFLTELLLLFVNPLVIILLVAAAVSGFIGQILDAGIIAGMVLIGIGINFFQTYRSKIAIENLRARVAPTATVLRDGHWQETDRKKLREIRSVYPPEIWSQQTPAS